MNRQLVRMLEYAAVVIEKYADNEHATLCSAPAVTDVWQAELKFIRVCELPT